MSNELTNNASINLTTTPGLTGDEAARTASQQPTATAFTPQDDSSKGNNESAGTGAGNVEGKELHIDGDAVLSLHDLKEREFEVLSADRFIDGSGLTVNKLISYRETPSDTFLEDNHVSIVETYGQPSSSKHIKGLILHDNKFSGDTGHLEHMEFHGSWTAQCSLNESLKVLAIVESKKLALELNHLNNLKRLHVEHCEMSAKLDLSSLTSLEVFSLNNTVLYKQSVADVLASIKSSLKCLRLEYMTIDGVSIDIIKKHPIDTLVLRGSNFLPSPDQSYDSLSSLRMSVCGTKAPKEFWDAVKQHSWKWICICESSLTPEDVTSDVVCGPKNMSPYPPECFIVVL
ncbi:hypothetical protein GQ42DRAFT_165241 [Ramicandelaber brevisporus]|nr:hypothetical protein GQ42DRAFT_165241 [Ramicandelaber brevisporus]